MEQLLTVEQALEHILARITPVPTELVRVDGSLGRVLREPVVSRVDLPPFASSAMDGFAMRAEETPGELPVAFRIAAGSPSARALLPGAAAGVATGGAVPEGADTVVPIEQVVDRGDRVVVGAAASAGEHVRPRGGDTREGDTVLGAGSRIGSVHIGAMSAVGVREVVCSARPHVAVLATGSELRASGERLAPGEIYESNRAMIAAALAPAGAEIELLPVIADDASAHRDALEQGLAADVLVSSGGVSMGPHDLVRSTAKELGVEEVFWGVAVKPGKPLSFGVRGKTLVFGLPGNPVSSLVGAFVFVRPALLALQGATACGPEYLPGRVRRVVRRNAQRDEFVRSRRVVEEDGVVLEPLSGQESHMIVHAAEADALLHVPRGKGEIEAGAAVRYLTLD